MALLVRMRRPLFWWLLLVALAPATAWAQAQAVAMRVGGEVPNHLELSLADIASLPHQTVHVNDEKGVAIDYSGVAVADILQKAGAPLGKGLRGPNMALGVVASATDGYSVLYSLAEFDPAFSSRTIILADHRDGKPLDAHEGPLRIIVPGDKRGARWIRSVDALELVRVH